MVAVGRHPLTPYFDCSPPISTPSLPLTACFFSITFLASNRCYNLLTYLVCGLPAPHKGRDFCPFCSLLHPLCLEQGLLVTGAQPATLEEAPPHFGRQRAEVQREYYFRAEVFLISFFISLTPNNSPLWCQLIGLMSQMGKLKLRVVVKER